MRSLICWFAVLAPLCSQPLPITGIAHVAFRVKSIEKTRNFYHRVLGFEEPFEFPNEVVFFKVNERQFIELYPGDVDRIDHVAFETPDAPALHRALQSLGMQPGDIQHGRAGNDFFSMKDTKGNQLEFVEYRTGSLHMNSAGKSLGPRRISNRILAAAINSDYGEKLGIADLIEPSATDRIIFEGPAKRVSVNVELRPVSKHLDRWRSVADRLLNIPANKWAWDWGEGVQMIGMMKIFEHTHHKPYAEYVADYGAAHLPKGADELLAVNARGFCGLWSSATALQYLRQDPIAKQTAEFILHKAQRSPEGGLGHWMGNHQYWVDTLYMAAPLLSALGHADESARQIDIFARRLQDPATGLYYHMYDWDKQTHTPALWGRGNGWVLMSIADTLEKLDENNPLYARLQQIALQQLKGLVTTQDATGMWHTVLDDPKSYPETSATAMFVYGIRKLIRLNAIPESYERIARRAWSGINENYVKNGLVTGVSAGTVPKESDYYRNLPLGTETWGTGAYLMAGSEVAR